MRGTTCHAHRQYFVPNCNIFSVLSVFKYNSSKTSNKFITSQSFLSSDIIPTSSKENDSDELLYTDSVTRYGPRTTCQRQGLKPRDFRKYDFEKIVPFDSYCPLL